MYDYQFIMRFYNEKADFKNIEKDLEKGKDSFNNTTSVGQITEFATLTRGVIITYSCKKELVRPACALSRLSRIWLQTIPGFHSNVLDKRIFREVLAIPLH